MEEPPGLRPRISWLKIFLLVGGLAILHLPSLWLVVNGYDMTNDQAAGLIGLAISAFIGWWWTVRLLAKTLTWGNNLHEANQTLQVRVEMLRASAPTRPIPVQQAQPRGTRTRWVNNKAR